MKLNHSVLFLTIVLVTSLFSCQKETITPSSEEYVVYESVIPADRAANTATVNWSSTAAVDARFEVVDPVTNAVLYSYGWINFTSASNTANYTVASGSTVKLRIKARRGAGAPVSTLSYTFSSSCSIVCCNTGTMTVNAPAGTSFLAIPGNALTTGACL